MKKTVRVVITKEIEIDIPDEMLTDDAIMEFSSYMSHIDSVDELFEFAGQYVARLDMDFVEGIGKVQYTEFYEDVETEILK